MSASPSSKDQKQLAVSLAILEIIEREGLLGVTHAKVSRRSGVSRAWIYEYVGKEIVEHGAEVFASYISRASLVEMPRTREELVAQLRDGVGFLFDSVSLNPVVIKLYYKFRGSDNALGEVIAKHEQKWVSSASRTLASVMGLSTEHARLLAEFMVTMRLAFAHKIATSRNARAERKKIETMLEFVNSMLGA